MTHEMSQESLRQNQRRQRIFVILFFAGLACAAVAMHFFPPTAENSLWPRCLFHSLTGLLCPGCGSTRAVYAFTHGRFLYALRCNALLPFLLIALIAILNPTCLHLLARRRIYIAALTVVILYAILRNILPHYGMTFLTPYPPPS